MNFFLLLKRIKRAFRSPNFTLDDLSDLFYTPFQKRRKYYLNEYLKSEAWQRKRHIVLKRDNWKCVRCGGKATQVHHSKYAKHNIGKEPIEWLISVCASCHNQIHS